MLSASEQQRYRDLGREAAAAISEVMRAARPDWTELALAAEGARALWRRGIEPALVLAAGSRRLPLYRHPTPTAEALGERAMLVFGARRHGLYANLTRCVSFGAAPLPQADLMTVEATALAACVAGNALSAVYHALGHAYRHAGHPDALREGGQGGVTGYLAREQLATASSALALEHGMALAFHPASAACASRIPSCWANTAWRTSRSIPAGRRRAQAAACGRGGEWRPARCAARRSSGASDCRRSRQPVPRNAGQASAAGPARPDSARSLVGDHPIHHVDAVAIAEGRRLVLRDDARGAVVHAQRHPVHLVFAR